MPAATAQALVEQVEALQTQLMEQVGTRTIRTMHPFNSHEGKQVDRRSGTFEEQQLIMVLLYSWMKSSLPNPKSALERQQGVTSSSMNTAIP